MTKNDVTVNVPNIVMWSWMRTVLNLTGAELLIFSYLFSQTFDDVHKCYTCLSDMETWFGITRQTISRNIDKLCARGFVEKEILSDAINPMIKHNNYKVCVQYITKLCEKSDYNSYANFLDSYGMILKQKFPDDETTIDEYLTSLATWHKNKDIEVCITLNEVAQLISSGSSDNHISIIDMLTDIRNKNKSIKKFPEKAFKQTSPNIEPTKKQDVNNSGLFANVKPKRKSKKAKLEEWYTEKKNITQNFMYMKLGGNDELQELLYKFLETDNGMSYTPPQWEQQLDNMFVHGRTVDRMISGVKNSYMNNYRTLYIVDKSEVDIDEKFSAIDDYVSEQCDNNKELKDLLYSYVTDVSKGKSCTIRQFNMLLENLSNICVTTEEKIKSVKTSYANSYSALAYPRQSYNTNNQSNEEAIDIEEKIKCVKDFIHNGYYYLCDGLEEALLQYVESTSYGRSVDVKTFYIMLDSLRLFCLNDIEKVAKVKLAIQNNYSKFATEDFAETKRLKDSLRTREDVAKHNDRSRKLAVIKEKQRHPNNPKIVNVDVS